MSRSLVKNPAVLLALFVFSGGIFLYLVSLQPYAHIIQQQMLGTMLLITAGAVTIFTLLVLLYRSSVFSRPPLAQDRSDTMPCPTMVSHDLSILSRLQYAVDQHSIISKTDVSGRIVYVNDLFETVSGYRRNELIGQSHRVIKSDIHPEEFFTEMWQTISQGRIWHGEVCNRRKNGEYYWVESTIVPFVNERGNPYEYISVRTDISKIKKYEQELVLAKNEAEEANKSKSRFLSNISHELRTPLNAIMGFTQVLEINETIDAEGKAYLEEISKAGRYLVSLFDDLLDMGCVENGTLSVNLTEECLYDILDECVKLSSVLAVAQGIQLHIDLGECRSDRIQVDRKRLKQVVLNLLTNAIKYNSENGKVTLTCARSPDHMLLVEITDTGIGMTAEEINQIFQPFVRVGEGQTRIRGAGLGLALSKSIMQKMGGDIIVDSQAGQGSQFTIKLPQR